MNSNTYSILNFVTNYILTPSINIYDSTVEYFKNLFSNNDTEYIEVNIETKRIILGFTHNDINYKITSHIFQNNLKQVYEKIKEDLENNTFELKQFLGASINDEHDITEIINEYAGPFGDFYQRYGIETSIKSIIPEKYHEGFSTVELMDNDGEIYYFFNLNDILTIGKDINWFKKLHPEEQKNYIKHCPYI
jgi:hypothetical protein